MKFCYNFYCLLSSFFFSLVSKSSLGWDFGSEEENYLKEFIEQNGPFFGTTTNCRLGESAIWTSRRFRSNFSQSEVLGNVLAISRYFSFEKKLFFIPLFYFLVFQNNFIFIIISLSFYSYYHYIFISLSLSFYFYYFIIISIILLFYLY